MKVYSWNMLFANKHISEVQDFITRLDFDVLCMQEVPEELLAWLQNFGAELAYGTDVRDSTGLHTYVVIVSRHPITKSEAYTVPIPSTSPRARVTIGMMSVVHRWHSTIEKGAVYADIVVNGKTWRIFSVHLTLAGPTFRTQEFKVTLDQRAKDKPEIIAGDFNIIEHPLIKLCSWLLGSPLNEGMPWFPERAQFNKILAAEHLENPLAGRITHPFSMSQLDHILVTRNIHVSKAWVELDSHGSDHQPIGIEITEEFERPI